VTFANNVVLGGHVKVGDHVFIGGQTAVHQFVQIGEGAMISGVSGVAYDIIPFGFALGQFADLVGLNVVGLRRRGHSRESIRQVRRAYQLLFLGEGLFADRVAKTEMEFGNDPLVRKILDFVRAKRSRALMMVGTHSSDTNDPT
jgi:UDP-N-acetylglucosamine acyltransferase